MPTRSQVHISAPLTNVAVKYKHLPFVAERALPVLPVVKESDKYWVFGREEMKPKDDLRAPGALANEMEWGDLSANAYSCEEHALRKIVPDRIVDNADTAIKPRASTTEKLAHVVNLNYEKRVQTLLQNTGSFDNDFAADTYDEYWDDSTTDPDIELQVKHAKNLIRQAAGINPNTMLLNAAAADALVIWLRKSSDSTYNELVTGGELPDSIWNLEIIEAEALEDTAEEGQTETIADIWNDNVAIYYRETGTPDLQSLSFGYTFRARNFITKNWRDEGRDGEFIEVSVIQDELIIASGAGCLITDVIE